jgi:hypothetical protein
VVVLVWLCVGVCGTGSDESCLGLFESYDQGVYVCRSHPDLVVALQIAEEMGRVECQRAFAGERWNCSGFSLLRAPNVTSRVTKEAAYVHALSLAAIAHSVAKVCAMGEATSCSCEDEPLDLPQADGDTEYAMGCSDNVEFGLSFAARFLRLRHHGEAAAGPGESDSDGDGETNVLLHNLMTAAQVVEEKTSAAVATPCKCLGVSGSCTLFSCPHKSPEFPDLAAEILRLYRRHTCRQTESATKVTTPHEHGGQKDTHAVGENEGSGGSPEAVVASAPQRASCAAPHGERQLLYLHESPDYCVRSPGLGSPGTVGRECNPHTTGPGSCQHLCTGCGRGHANATRSVEETCYCSFRYCCDVQCFKCSRTKFVSVCS